MTLALSRPRARRLLREDRGATATEYAVMFAVILVVIFVSVQQFGQGLSELYGRINGSIPW